MARGHHPYYPSLPPISREMGPPLDFPLLQPMEIDLSASRTMLPQGFGGMSYASSTVPRMAPIDGYNRPQDPITQWYNGNDGPWVPQKVIPAGMENRLPSKYSYQYTHPLDLGSSVQYNTSYSDSGYGSRRSVGNTSVFSVDQDCQSLTSHVTDYHHSFPAITEVIHQRNERISEVWTEPSELFVCPICNKSVKTQSELKKHDLRHTKPFICQVLGCPRSDGFSTSNDLDRHTKSKHASNMTEGPTKKFRCYVSGCKSKNKSWPRLDNFRSHLKRVHSQLKDDALDNMIKRAEFWENPSNIDQDLVIHMPVSQPRFVEEAHFTRERRHDSNREVPAWKPLPMGIPMEVNEPMEDAIQMDNFEDQGPIPMEVVSELESPAPEMPQLETVTVQPQHVFQRPSSVPVVRTTLPLSLVSRSNTSDSTSSQTRATKQTLPRDASVTDVIKSILASSKSPEKTDNKDSDRSVSSGNTSPSDRWPSDTRNTSSEGSTPSDHTDISLTESVDIQKQADEVVRVLQERGLLIKQKDQTDGPSNLGSAAGNKSEHQVLCSTCKKFKGRPCELKKHMKRHERPFGCTFLTCRKTFGSKNDWKRHENSQHFHLETWRCDEVLPESEGAPVCGKVCYRKQTFQEHLTKSHGITSEEKQKVKLDKCRIGRNCQSRFWCGFCERTVELKKNGLDAWTERFDHIDDHFSGRHGRKQQSISDWTPVDEDKSDKGLDVDSSKTHATSRVNSTAMGSSSSKRNRSSEVVEDNPRGTKLAKTSAARDILIFCCQCGMQHNETLDQSCMTCTDSHRFCTACKRQYAEKANI